MSPSETQRGVDHVCIKCPHGESAHTLPRDACSAPGCFCRFFECPPKRLPWRTFSDVWGMVGVLRKTRAEADAQTADFNRRNLPGRPAYRTRHWNGREWVDVPAASQDPQHAQGDAR